LVDYDGNARVTDFGLAAVMHATKTVIPGRHTVDLRWMAPELLAHERHKIIPGKEGVPTIASDCYALAITMWEVSHVFPFSFVSNDRVKPCLYRY
jgi:hypothetical protein